MNVEEILRGSGHPKEFIEQYRKSKDKTLQETVEEKKPIYIQLESKSDDVLMKISSRLKTTLTRTYPV